MTNLKVFENEEFGKIRTLVLNEEPWFVGRDVALALGYKRPADAVSSLVDSEDKGVGEIPTPGGKQKMTILNESGLYSLILSSKLPSAKKFKRWVTNEVLPTIRKTGGYINDDEVFIETYFGDMPEDERAVLRVTLKNLRIAKEQVKVLQPKGEYFDELIDKSLLTNLRDTAKELGLRQKQFITWLLDKKYLYRDKHGRLKAYSEYIHKEYFQYKDWKSDHTTGIQVLVTPQGKAHFLELIKKGSLVVSA